MQAFATFVAAMTIGFTASWKITLVVIASLPVTILSYAVQAQAMMGSGEEGVYFARGCFWNYSNVYISFSYDRGGCRQSRKPAG
jgi:hypothetical protein